MAPHALYADWVVATLQLNCSVKNTKQKYVELASNE